MSQGIEGATIVPSKAELLSSVCQTENLPSPPTVAVEVLRLTRNEDVKVDQLVKVIQNDPALVAKILRVVNSSMFGLTRKVTSLHQATVVLGTRTLKVFALSFSLVDTIGSCAVGAFDYQGYWRRSLTTAVAARLLGKAMKSSVAEEAFVAGLLSDIGIVAALRTIPTHYMSVLEQWVNHKRLLTDAERELLGVTHGEMGRALLKKWGLPGALFEAVGAHHGDYSEVSEGQMGLARIVACAARLSALFCNDVSYTELAVVKGECVATLAISPGNLEEALQVLDQNVRDTAATLSVTVGTTINYPQLQAEATMMMAQLSVAAEIERAETRREAETAKIETQRLQEEKRQILEIASTDGLTKVNNRAAFDKRLTEEWEKARAANESLGLIMIDVDHFKKFNDTHGHQAGDEVLRFVGRTLQHVAQSAGFVARYGGEEFAVLVANATEQKIRALAEEIRRAIERGRVAHGQKELHVTASLGATRALPKREARTASEFVSSADKLLYTAKHRGRNRVETE